MENSLFSLETFVTSQPLHNGDLLDLSDVLAYVGPGLKVTLARILEHCGVGDTPVIHGEVHPQAIVEGPVYIAAGARVEATAFIKGPAYIGPETEVRHGAYIRGNVYVGRQCVVGHATEVKGAVFFDGAKAGHFSYVGDSVLGSDVNLGAGTKLANLKLKRSMVKVTCPHSKKRLNSGLDKLGAILGYEAQTGCNSVLSPGTILRPMAVIGPCEHGRGLIEKLI